MEFYDASAPVDPAAGAPPSLQDLGRAGAESDLDAALRSEEHTSELQSH